MKKRNQAEGELLGHDYDGIQEFDNPLPNWWLATFYGAIIFSFFYVGYYHFGPGPSLDDELLAGLEKVKAQEASSQRTSAPLTNEVLAAAYADPAVRAAGKKIFAEKCLACHGANGEGQIGPNLTDAYWIHGDGALAALVKVISEGVPEKGMPPWSTLLKQPEVVAVASHVKSLRGTKPASPKPPQGELVKD